MLKNMSIMNLLKKNFFIITLLIKSLKCVIYLQLIRSIMLYRLVYYHHRISTASGTKLRFWYPNATAPFRMSFASSKTTNNCEDNLLTKPIKLDLGSSDKWTPSLLSAWACR